MEEQEKTKRHYLRPTYYDEKKAGAFADKVEGDRVRLNDAVAVMRGHGIEIDDADALREISGEWLRDFLNTSYNEMIARIGGKFMPTETRRRLAEPYDETGRECEPAAKTIAEILSRNKYRIKKDSKGHFWFDEKEVKQAATEYATTTFSETTRTYYGLLADFTDMVNRIAEYETAKGLPHLILEGQTVVGNVNTADGVMFKQSLQELTRETDARGRNKDRCKFDKDVFVSLIKDGVIVVL